MQGVDSLEKSDAGKDGRLKEKRAAEDELLRWHPGLKGHEQAPEDSEGQESVACSNPWGGRVGHDLAMEQQQRDTHQRSFSGSDSAGRAVKRTTNQRTPRGVTGSE